MNRRHSRSIWLVLGWLLSASTALAGPVVTSITPDAARPGDILEVVGTGFKGTREVLFASGSSIKLAKFTVVNDEQLNVVFPEYYRGTGSASIIVLGAGGVTVAMSDQMKTVDGTSKSVRAAPFLKVVNDGTVTSGGGIAVIEEGGVVMRSYPAPVVFVKSKGTLAEFSGAILFHESGAVIGPKIKAMKSPPKVITVHEITISPNVKTVTIKTPEAPQPFAKLPPVLTAITPAEAMPGDIVQVQGKNLGHVSEVYFFDGSVGLVAAGFKAASDNVLRVEVPQGCSRRQLVIAVNPVGCAVNITELPLPHAPSLNRPEELREMANDSTFIIEYIRPGKIENHGGGSRVFVVGDGGLMTGMGGNCCLLVKNGGRLAGNLGANCSVFHESNAGVSSSTSPAIRDVGKIIFSPRRINLDVVHRH